MLDQLSQYFTLSTRFNKLGEANPLVRTVSQHELLELAAKTRSQSLKAKIYKEYSDLEAETLLVD